jgi:hypothetical protein
MEDATSKNNITATINLQYRRAEGEPLIDCGDVEMILQGD